MSSPSRIFECRWGASRQLLAVYLGAQCCALLALLMAAIPLSTLLLGVGVCAAHACWVGFSSLYCFTGIRHDADGWHLCRADGVWLSVQLRPDSLALPQLIVLRFRQPGQWWARGLCIAGDALPADTHRRLRVRLKFTRHRWAAPE